MEKLRQKARARFTFAAFLGQMGKRCTPERLLVLDTVLDQRKPFSAEALLQACINSPGKLNVCRATVFNTLPLLVRAGFVVKHSALGDDNTYEAVRPSSTPKPRLFLVCTACGKVSKRSSQAFANWINTQSFRDFSGRAESAVTYIYGECSRCRKSRKKT